MVDLAKLTYICLGEGTKESRKRERRSAGRGREREREIRRETGEKVEPRWRERER